MRQLGTHRHRGRLLGIGIAAEPTGHISMIDLAISKLPMGAGISAAETQRAPTEADAPHSEATSPSALALLAAL
jgi:hypothetical protein